MLHSGLELLGEPDVGGARGVLGEAVPQASPIGFQLSHKGLKLRGFLDQASTDVVTEGVGGWGRQSLSYWGRAGRGIIPGGDCLNSWGGIIGAPVPTGWNLLEFELSGVIDPVGLEPWPRLNLSNSLSTASPIMSSWAMLL